MRYLTALLTDLSDRLKQTDMLQFMTLFFALQMVVLFATWPTNNQLANDSWFALMQLKALSMTLLGVGYGSHLSNHPASSQRITCLALCTIVILSFPFDLSSYAASFPATPPAWTLIILPLSTTAMFGLGLLLGHISSFLRIRALLPLSIPALIFGLFALDISLGHPISNPFSAITTVAPYHLIFVTIISLLTLRYVLRRKPQASTQEVTS